jgi:LuxR family maltose regulon positive regulatory protein
LNELVFVDTTCVLVLDDYHVLSNRQLHEGVEFLLSYLPPALQLVIAGRADPPLPLPRLRARGDLTEIRMDDLSFSAAEIGALVSSLADVDLDEAAARSLQERTEGWAAGLQLAALRLGDQSSIEEIDGDDRHILDFFSTEVIPALSWEQRDLLVRTSVLERLSGPLCDTALNRTGSADLLAELDKSNVFVVPLDKHRVWYRCHRLFRDALQRLIEPQTAAGVLGKAADWFLAQDLVEDAIVLKIEAGDIPAAVALLRASVPWFLQHGAGRMLRLGDQLGFEAAAADPHLSASLAWVAAGAGQFHQMGRWLDAAEQSMTDDADPPLGWHSLPGALCSLRAMRKLAAAEVKECIVLADRGVEFEPDPAVPGYVLARHVLGTAHLVDDRPSAAVPILEEAWQRSRNPRFPPLVNLQPACSLAIALFQTGRYAEAHRVCVESTPTARAVEQTWGDGAALGIAPLHMVAGRLALQNGDVVEGDRLSRRAVALSTVWGHPSQMVMALTTYAEVKLAAKDLPAARAAINQARELTETEKIWPFAVRELDDVDRRVGRGALRAARQPGILVEELTDRELQILRMLPGSANQREIGSALFLSINTVKGYAKSLYRKLGVNTRQEAVERARDLGLT